MEKILGTIKKLSCANFTKKYLKKCKPENGVTFQSEEIQKLLGDCFFRELQNAIKRENSKIIYEEGYVIDVEALATIVETAIGELISEFFDILTDNLKTQREYTKNLTNLLHSFLIYNPFLNRSDAITKMISLSKRSRENKRDDVAYFYKELASQLEKNSDNKYEEIKHLVAEVNKIEED